MITDTVHIASLPTCGRRVVYTTQEGKKILCEPPSKLPPGNALELMASGIMAKRFSITCRECMDCQMREPVVITNTPKYEPIILRPEEGFQPQVAQPIFATPNIDPITKIVTYIQATNEPPPIPEGYKRKSNDPTNPGAWVLIPLGPPCAKMQFRETKSTGGCGCIHLMPICSLTGNETTVELCKQCPNRVIPT